MNRENWESKDRAFPWVSLAVLGIILAGCCLADLICGKDPSYLDTAHVSQPPGPEFWFGTDTLGRDLFSCIWHGGRVSLLIGFLSTAVSAAIAVLYGTVSGLAGARLDLALMRLAEVFLSVPSLLWVLFLQAVLGEPTVWSLSLTIGATGWCSIAKVVRAEVRRLKKREYVVAARAMGGGFFYILRKHLAPNFFPSILFMVVMDLRTAIVSESTLSFLGMGLPLSVVSWGSMLSLAENALLTRSWWIIWIPGFFVVVLLLSVTQIGNWLRRRLYR